MTKRRITRRQAWRINKIHQQRSARAAKQENSLSVTINETQLGVEQVGLLITRYGTTAEVEDKQGNSIHCQLRQHLGTLVAGDKVIWQRIDEEHGVIVAREERTNILGRPNKHDEIKPMAANIDQFIIITAPIPQLSTYLIDCYLVAAENLTIKPLILLNKMDLLSDGLKVAAQEQLQLYHQLGYTVLFASIYQAHGLDALLQQLHDKVSVLVGQSGVGKSSLIQALLPQQTIRTTELSARSGLGQHTTTAATLYHLPQGGNIIDSPGIREFGLWHMQQQQIAQGFIEFRAFLGKCHFRNCHHQHEPHCALKAAVAAGKIHPQRLANYLKIGEQLVQ